MKLVSIVGARPQFVKVAPLARAINRHNESGRTPIEHLIVHTGQHYDVCMSDVFFEELELPCAAFNLGVGSGSHGKQTGQMLEKIEQVLLETDPDMVVIYGDTNSTVAGALAAAKLHMPVAHIEAGLRSFNRHMPEEINRIVADHLSDVLLTPTPTATHNLTNEGLSTKAVFTGDIMYDVLLFNRGLAPKRSCILSRLSLEPGNYGVVTLHRAENTGAEERLGDLLTVLNNIAATTLRLVFPVHPRTAKMIATRFAGWSAHDRLNMIDPIGYLDMLSLVEHARLTLTDSGGLQKEALFLGCPCITLRDETEWIETVQAGGNIVAGTSPEKIHAALSAWQSRLATGDINFASTLTALFGDGSAADKIKDALLVFHQ